MTEERSNELMGKMLWWIGNAIGDDRKLYETLHNRMGMTEEELLECGIEDYSKLAHSADHKAQLEHKVRDCYKEFYDSWLMKQPIDLVERAEEIASIQRMVEELPSAVTEEDAAYLLRFKNPLEVVSDRWQSMNGSGSVVDDDMSHILWELRDRRDAECDYEMEPEYYEQPAPQSPQMTQQMSM